MLEWDCASLGEDVQGRGSRGKLGGGLGTERGRRTLLPVSCGCSVDVQQSPAPDQHGVSCLLSPTSPQPPHSLSQAPE